MNGFFVTGTDTGVGKTRIAVALVEALSARGQRVAVMKPVAAGCAPGRPNDDVVALRAASSVDAALADVNPYSFAEPVAPHIAAERTGTTIALDRIGEAFERLAAGADVVVVEGAGGWRVPLNAHEDMADLAVRLGLPVVLVVGLRLGCLNHAILTAEAIAARGLWAGWIGNHIDADMREQRANLDALHARLPGPCLGVHPYVADDAARPEPAGWLTLPR